MLAPAGWLRQLPEKLGRTARPRVLARTESSRTQSGTIHGGPRHDHWARLGVVRYTISHYSPVMIALFRSNSSRWPREKKIEPRVRRGLTPMLSVSSDRSAENVWITSSSPMSATCTAFYRAIFNTITATRTHLSLGKNCPRPRPIQFPSAGNIIAFPEVGGLHHRYERRAA
jgi:hypothetical protein